MPVYRRLLDLLLARSRDHYGDRLISLVVFGSVGRKTAGPESDVDLLYVVDPLPRGRGRRVAEFAPIEEALATALDEAADSGIETCLSPLFKTPVEVKARSPILLDMVDDALVLYDRDDFFQQEMAALRQRLKELGARRIYEGDAWYWDLAPGYRHGMEIEI